MKKFAVIAMTMLILLLAANLYAVQPDAPKCKDHPLFPTRMPNYRIEKCEIKDFDTMEFFTKKGPKLPVEGKTTFIQYTVDNSKDSRSGIEVVRNYENALKKIAGKIEASSSWWVNGSAIVNGKEVWVQAERGNMKIWLKIVEKQAMTQTIVADAKVLGNDIRTTGHVAVYGIYFDTGKSNIKPESEQAIGEIAKMLKSDPGLKIHVVGHTDNVGGVESNIKLSQSRAESVVQALRNNGIASGRLRAFGCGQFAPVMSNDNEDGRAKNRRVELVKQ